MSGFPLPLLRGFLRVAYGIVKLVTRVDRRKIVFLSRRLDRMPLDFRMLADELQRRNPDVRVAALTMHVKGTREESLRFIPVLLRSLHHLATAKVAVLDSYWPAVSMLDHRRELVVYQLWHSLGKIKQSGKQSLGRAQGRSHHVAREMRMHEGYDYVVAGAKAWNPQYRASFGVTDEQLLNIGLPRADHLVNDRDEIAARIRARHPELGDKPVVLYVPTFRRGEQARGAVLLADALDLDRCTLVVKKHDSDSMLMPAQPHLQCPDFTGTELLTIADVVVTDYSSIALEAALIDVKTFYFLYDHEHYLAGNGVNIDLDRAMPGCVFRDASALAAALDADYPVDVLRAYKETFVFPDPGHSTADLADHIFSTGALCTR